MGKSDFHSKISEEVSDLVGEKLTVVFVTECLNRLGYLEWEFCCLVPVLGDIPYYCLLLEESSEKPEAIAKQLEDALQSGFHYHKAREAFRASNLQVIIHKQVIQSLQRSKRLGNCKCPILATKPFEPEQVDFCSVKCSVKNLSIFGHISN